MIANEKIIAHRGVFDNRTIPENSISSFKKAMELFLPFELDVQLTKDNILVVFHDENLKRMCGVDKKVQDTTYEEIKNYRLLDSNETIPRLTDILKMNNDFRLIDIEVKNTKRILETTNELFRCLQGYNNYIVKSFNPKIVKRLKKRNPNMKVGYIINDKYDNGFHNFLLKKKFMIKYCHADFIAISQTLFKKDKYKKMATKIPTMVWTIKYRTDIEYSDDITYICENLPYDRGY